MQETMRDIIADITRARIKSRIVAISKDRLTVLDEMQVSSEVFHLRYQLSVQESNIRLFSKPVGDRVA